MAAIKKAEVNETKMLEGLMTLLHNRLVAYGVRVGMEFAVNEKGDSSAVKLHGYPCAAIIRITGLKERRWGAPDAIVTVDQGRWDRATDKERAALLDHELTHLAIDFDKDKNGQFDAAARPKLKMRLHDFQVGWFAEVAARHGDASYEVRQAREIGAAAAMKCTQLRFAFEDGIRLADEGEAPELDAPAEAEIAVTV
jgi:hypothetical protein